MLRRLSRSFALRIVVAASLCGSAAAGGANVPDWMRQAAAQPLGTYPPETKAVVLLDQTDYTVTAPGDYVEHSRWVVKILRPEGRKEGDLNVDLGQKEKLNYIHAWTIDRSGRDYEVKEKDFAERSFPSFILYSDIRFFTAKAPAADPGSIIALEWEVRRHSWVNQINQFFQETNPLSQIRISLTLPPAWEFKDSWPAGSALTAVQIAPGHWEWIAHDLPGIQEEPMMPREFVLMGRMAIAYFPPGETVNWGSWQALGRWYSGLTLGRRDPTPEISHQVQELIAGKSDFDSKLRVLTAFLQSEIRYVAIEIGIGGYQPHAAASIFRYHYGDCKDKVTLLSSMLREAGIQSDYVLIDSARDFVNPSVPSVWFDHAIIAIEIPDDVKGNPYQSVVISKSAKRYIIFDPTDEYTPVGFLRSELQNSYALLVTDSGGELIRTPLQVPDSNSVTRTGHFVLAPDGGLSGNVSEDRSGDSAMYERERLHYTDARERTSNFERWLGHSIQGFTLEDMKIEQADQITKNLIINYRFTTPQYGQQRGPLMLLRPRVLDNKSSQVEHKPRHYAIELGATTRQTDDYEIEIPKDYRVEDIPDPVKVDVGFASYQSKTQVDGSKLHYWREYIVRELSVAPEKFEDWVKLQGMIGADETAAVVLKRVD